MQIDINSFKSILGRDESVEWAGRPEPFETIDKYNKKPFMIRLIAALAIAVILIVIYYVKMAGQTQPAVPVILIAVAAFVIITPLLDARAIRKKRVYIITDKNIYTYGGETSSKKMPLSILDEVKILDKGDGISDVFFGSAAIKKPYKKIRSVTLQPIESDVSGQTVICGIVYYNIAGAEKIKALLPSGVKITEEKL